MDDTKQPIWQLVHLCAQELTRKGITPFTRDNLISCVQRTHPGCNPNTINPVIQGLTDNLRGGAPVAVGKDLLHSVGRGRFVLNADVAQKPDKWASVEEALRTGKVVSVEPIQEPQRAPTPKGSMLNIEGNLRAYLGRNVSMTLRHQGRAY